MIVNLNVQMIPQESRSPRYATYPGSVSNYTNSECRCYCPGEPRAIVGYFKTGASTERMFADDVINDPLQQLSMKSIVNNRPNDFGSNYVDVKPQYATGSCQYLIVYKYY